MLSYIRGDGMERRSLNANQLKMIALVAMTVDHVAAVVRPNYPTGLPILALHAVGRLAAPIFWFFIAEGYRHTRDLRRYALRLLACAAVGHFAYAFAFGIPFVPFRSSAFNQTSVLWPLFWGVVALAIDGSGALKRWQKGCALLAICALTFCADWSCIAVLAILEIGSHRGNFRRQMGGMMAWVAVYALVYAIFIHPIYGALQLCAAMTIPLLRRYNGERGRWKGMKWLFYGYYPLHLLLCGLLRLALHGNIAVMIGG